MRASQILLDWLVGVLDLYKLTLDDLVATVTDAGPDVKRLGNILLEAVSTTNTMHVSSARPMVMLLSFITAMAGSWSDPTL